MPENAPGGKPQPPTEPIKSKKSRVMEKEIEEVAKSEEYKGGDGGYAGSRHQHSDRTMGKSDN